MAREHSSWPSLVCHGGLVLEGRREATWLARGALSVEDILPA